MIVVKEFTAEAFQPCAELLVRTFNAPPWNDRWTAETANAYLRELVGRQRFLGFALWEEGALAGAALCHIKTHYEGDEIYIEDLFVAPDRQGKGHGTALMDAVEAYADAHELISVTLLTAKDKPSFRFYKKRGYRQAKSMVFMIKGREWVKQKP